MLILLNVTGIFSKANKVLKLRWIKVVHKNLVNIFQFCVHHSIRYLNLIFKPNHIMKYLPQCSRSSFCFLW